MRPLTAAERELAVRHLPLAAIVARSVHSASVDYETRLSAAYLGLCYAARDWRDRPGGAAFPTYATTAMRRQIYREWRPLLARPTVRLGEFDIPDPLSICYSDIYDEAAYYLGRIGDLPRRQRQVMEGIAAGSTNPEIGRRLGINPGLVDAVRRQAAAALRAAPPAASGFPATHDLRRPPRRRRTRVVRRTPPKS